MRRTPSAARLLLLSLLAAMLLVPAPAQAATKDAHPEVTQCFSATVANGCSLLGPAGFRPVDVEISPDGRQVYVLDWTGELLVVDRGADGRLTPRTSAGSCFNATGTDGCTAMASLASTEAYDLELSPDGTSVYVATGTVLATLGRAPATGNLTPGACYGPTAGCTAVANLSTFVMAVAVSPGSQNVYLRSNNRLHAFDRNPSTGALTLKAGADGCYTESPLGGCSNMVGLVGTSYEMAVSPEGAHLYVTNSAGVAVFSRNATGALAQAAGPAGGCLTSAGFSSNDGDCQSLGASGNVIDNTWAAVVSPSGKHVFLSGELGSTAFARNATTGALTLTDCLAPFGVSGCRDVNAAAGMGVEVSPDGTRAIVGGEDVAGFGVYDFDESTGKLTQLPAPEGCFSGSGAAGCTDAPGGRYAKAVWAPDGRTAYVVPTSRLLTLRQDFPPVCQPVTASTAHGAPVTVTLTCSDSDGDTITGLNAGTSMSGSVSAVDQAARTVTFTPAVDFTGAAAFTYTGTANGRTSAPATVTINVAAPVDSAVTISIAGGKVKLNEKGKAKIRLTCPATEASGPCAGKLTVKTRSKVELGGKKKVVTLDSAKYSIAAGKTKAVKIALTVKEQRLVRQVAAARKLSLVAKVADTAGNKTTVTKKAKLKLPG